ncbi:MAG: hypothetical protein ACMUJM_16230 [bacterium]
MMKYLRQFIMERSFIFLFICTLIVMMVFCSKASEGEHSSEQDTKQVTEDNKKTDSREKAQKSERMRLMYISLIKACKCTMERCNQGILAVETIKKKYPEKIDFEVLYYDKGEDTERVKQMAQKYGFATLPVLFIFNEKDEKVGSVLYSVSESAIEKELKRVGVL